MANIRAQTEALYASLPEVNCKGLCIHTCAPILVTGREAKVLKKATGVNFQVVDLGPDGDAKNQAYTDWCAGKACPLLKDGRCSAYESRPLICRLMGTTSDGLLHCPHGCCENPITFAEAQELLRRGLGIG